MSELVTIARVFERAEAMVARSLLESEGLKPLVPEEHVFSTLPYLILANGGYRLMVRTEDAETARAILRFAQIRAVVDEDA